MFSGVLSRQEAHGVRLPRHRQIQRLEEFRGGKASPARAPQPSPPQRERAEAAHSLPRVHETKPAERAERVANVELEGGGGEEEEDPEGEEEGGEEGGEQRLLLPPPLRRERPLVERQPAHRKASKSFEKLREDSHKLESNRFERTNDFLLKSTI